MQIALFLSGTELRGKDTCPQEKEKKEREISWRIWKEFSKVERMDNNNAVWVSVWTGLLEGYAWSVEGKVKCENFLPSFTLSLFGEAMCFLPSCLSVQTGSTDKTWDERRDSFGGNKEGKERKFRVKTFSLVTLICMERMRMGPSSSTLRNEKNVFQRKKNPSKFSLILVSSGDPSIVGLLKRKAKEA